MKLLRYIFIFFLLLSKISFAQSFITKVSAPVIGKLDVLQIEYQADDADIEQFVLPKFNNWTVISGPNLSSSTMQTGNIVKQQMVYSVIVQPNATGTLTVPGASALINSKPQKSNSVSVQVKNVNHLPGAQAPSQPSVGSLFDQLPFEDEVPSAQYLKKGEKAIDKIKNNILVRLEVNKQSCYVGEPILVTYKLCTRLRSKSKVVKQPQFTGCTVVELTGEDQDQHVEKVNGIDYNVFIIRKVQLVPLEAGRLVLPQASVENRVTFYNAEKLSYRDLYYNPRSAPAEEQLVTLQNKPETIEVKALPPFPSISNSDFSGAVGNFDATVVIKENNITTNTTNHLDFTIEGSGNIQQVKAPVINWPKGIEVFETTEQTQEDKSAFPVKYKKTFSFPFIANKKGNYSFPSLQFTYFDPIENKYITKATNAFLLAVAQGKRSFFHISNNTGEDEAFQERLYFLLGGVIVTVLIGLIWFNGKQKSQPQPVTETVITKNEKQAENEKHDPSQYLYTIRELQPDEDSSGFYKQLNQNILSYLHEKFGINADELLVYSEMHPELATSLLQLRELHENCNLGMYTPVFTVDQAMQHRLEAIKVLSDLESLSKPMDS